MKTIGWPGRFCYTESVIRSLQILVVEDKKNTAELIKSVLEANHFRVHILEDPFLALDVFRDDPISYNLIIYDLSIRKMSAFEFLKQARDENPDVKFVLITAVEIKSAEFSKVLPSLHINAFLDKQTMSDKIGPTISGLLGPRRMARSNIGKYR